MNDIVRTREQAETAAVPPLLVLDALADYLADTGLGTGPLRATRIGDGHSNVTYAIESGDRRMVLRRGPLPPHPPSTHDMMREARVQRLLAGAGVPVPRILAVCDEPSVLGVPFYLMEHLDGLVITDDVPAAFAGPALAQISTKVVDTLAALHAVDVTTGEISALGRPDGYLERQVDRFASLWPSVSRRIIPAVDTLADWLAANRPESLRAAVVHGDYRIGNLMFRPHPPVAVLAILDWEMATLGDPLADLGYFVATYAAPGAAATPMELTPATRSPGFPGRDELIERYVDATGADVRALPWYEGLALWKAAVFCEAIDTRWLDGESPADAFAPGLDVGVPILLAEAGRVAGIAVETAPRE